MSLNLPKGTHTLDLIHYTYFWFSQDSNIILKENNLVSLKNLWLIYYRL